jgi:SHS2 domain-containing protein
MFELFEHRADVGIRGFGKNREEAFAECAKAMFSVMVDLGKIRAGGKDSVEVEAQNPEELLIAFLNHLLYLRDVKGKVYNRFSLYITNSGGRWLLKGNAFGEKIDAERHLPKGDVKAASFHQLKVSEENGQWVAQCVLDI